MNNRTFRPKKTAALTTPIMLLLASCSAANEQQISAESNQAEITTTSIDWSKDQPMVDVTILLLGPSAKLPGPFVGPFDGTIETLGHCVEPDYPDDVEDAGWIPIDHDFARPEAWREVVSIDVSNAVLEPDGYQTADLAGVKIELASLGYPDSEYAHPQRQWVYEGELLLALDSELTRGRTVHIKSGPDGGVKGISIDDEGYVRFIGNCELRRSQRLQKLVEDLSEVRGTKVTAEDLYVEIQEAGSGEPALSASEELQAESEPLTWIELDPMDRQIDLTETPQEILDRLVSFEVRVGLPKTWTTEPQVLCPRQELGWSRLCAAGAAAVDGVLVFEMLVEAGKPVELWLMDRSGLNPRGPLTTIDGDSVSADGVELLIETDLSIAEVYEQPTTTELKITRVDK